MVFVGLVVGSALAYTVATFAGLRGRIVIASHPARGPSCQANDDAMEKVGWHLYRRIKA